MLASFTMSYAVSVEGVKSAVALASAVINVRAAIIKALE
jgi:hypothetical protein